MKSNDIIHGKPLPSLGSDNALSGLKGYSTWPENYPPKFAYSILIFIVPAKYKL